MREPSFFTKSGSSTSRSCVFVVVKSRAPSVGAGVGAADGALGRATSSPPESPFSISSMIASMSAFISRIAADSIICSSSPQLPDAVSVGSSTTSGLGRSESQAVNVRSRHRAINGRMAPPARSTAARRGEHWQRPCRERRRESRAEERAQALPRPERQSWYGLVQRPCLRRDRKGFERRREILCGGGQARQGGGAWLRPQLDPDRDDRPGVGEAGPVVADALPRALGQERQPRPERRRREPRSTKRSRLTSTSGPITVRSFPRSRCARSSKLAESAPGRRPATTSRSSCLRRPKSQSASSPSSGSTMSTGETSCGGGGENCGEAAGATVSATGGRP